MQNVQNLNTKTITAQQQCTKRYRRSVSSRSHNPSASGHLALCTLIHVLSRRTSRRHMPPYRATEQGRVATGGAPRRALKAFGSAYQPACTVGVDARNSSGLSSCERGHPTWPVGIIVHISGSVVGVIPDRNWQARRAHVLGAAERNAD